MAKYIMVLDAGTTSVRAILFDHDGNICAKAQKEINLYFPKAGWVEQDANQIWSALYGVSIEATTLANVHSSDIAAIGVANQRETVIMWNKETGEPIYKAIVWQCRRTSDLVDELKEQGYEDMICEKTGLRLDAYFSATKIKWILDNVEGARELAEQDKLMFGTVDTWIIYKATGGKVHVTDYSNASRTMLFNINTLQWDEDIMNILDIPMNIMPEVKSSSEIYGYFDGERMTFKIPIASAIGDQQAALFGQRCYKKGEVKNTYGTGCFLLMNTGEKPVMSKNGLVTTIAWGIDGKVTYALEGSIFVAGAAIQWLRDSMHLIDDSFDSEYMAEKASDTNGCYVVPAFTGLGAPHWDQYARGTIVGITRGTTKNHIIRATLESMAYQVRDVITAMKADAGLELERLVVDGGVTNNDFLMQFQADMLDNEVIRPENVEATALGAAYLAGLAVDFWTGTDEIEENNAKYKVFQPTMPEEEREKKYRGWNRAIEYSKGWAAEEEY